MIQFSRRVLFILQNARPSEMARSERKVSALAEAGYRICVIGPRHFLAETLEKPSEKTSKNILLLPYGFVLSDARVGGGTIAQNIRLFVWQFMLACKLFFTKGFDVIHLCGGPDTVFLLGRFFRFFFRKKILMDYAFSMPQLQRDGLNAQSYSAPWLEKMLLNTADVVIAANGSMARNAIARGKRVPDTVFVVRPAALSEGAITKKQAASVKNAPCLVMCAISAIEPNEGALCEIVRLVRHDRARGDIEFAVSAEEPAAGMLKRQAAILGVADCITFVDPKNALSFMEKAALCIYPCVAGKRSDSSTPDLLLEALALDKPAVQYDAVEGRFTSGESCIYISPGDTERFADAILQLADNTDLRAKMAEAAHARFNELFAWPLQKPQLLAAYDKLFLGMEERLPMAEVEQARFPDA